MGGPARWLESARAKGEAARALTAVRMRPRAAGTKKGNGVCGGGGEATPCACAPRNLRCVEGKKTEPSVSSRLAGSASPSWPCLGRHLRLSRRSSAESSW